MARLTPRIGVAMKQAIRLLCLCTIPAWSQTAPKLYMTEPHLAPDRNELAFVSGGDIWRVIDTEGLQLRERAGRLRNLAASGYDHFGNGA